MDAVSGGYPSYTSAGDECERLRPQEDDDDGPAVGSIKNDLVDQVRTLLREAALVSASSRGACSWVGVEGGVRGAAKTSN